MVNIFHVGQPEPNLDGRYLNNETEPFRTTTGG